MASRVLLVVDTTGGNAIYSGGDLNAVVVVANTIEDARRFLNIYRPMLVIMDPIADRREGLLLFKRLINDNVAVIVQTIDDPMTYYKAGALFVLPKPLNREACQAAVKRWLCVLSKVDADALVAQREQVELGPRPRIALVDDSMDDAIAISSMYGDAFDVAWIPDVEELSRELVTQEFDLVLMDMNLAGADGLDVLQKLRQDLGMQVPVVFHSGLANGKSVSQAYRAGASDYIEKGDRSKDEVVTRLMLHVADGRALRKRA